MVKVRGTKPRKKNVGHFKVTIQKINNKDQRTSLSDLRAIAQKAIKEQGLTEQQVRKTLGMKKYE
ncbi:hypothetical protein [Clostridium novyi]